MSEQPFADRASGLGSRWDREERAACVEEVFVEEVAGREAGLDRDELLAWVALVGEEEEAGVDLADLVDALGEVVAAAEDPLSLALGAGARVGEADVGGDVELRWS